jgi:protein-S-isoprenylcysteine O-methyltransferase Ste14
MSTNMVENQPGAKVSVARLLRRGVQVLLTVAALAAMLFFSSGRLDWVMAWIYVGAFAIVLVVMVVYQELSNPELLAERSELKPREGVQTWDVILSAVVRLSLLTSYVVAGLDVRFGWKPELALAVQIAALVVGLLGVSLVVWAMAANRYAAVYARIQKERGHTVTTTGPYRFVRHPFYVGTITFSLTIPLVLGSPWAFIPGGLAALLFIVKTAAEDRMLREGLEGYREYAERVHYRLLPGIW